MKQWIEALKMYDAHGKIENCPCCGSDQVKVQIHEGKHRNSISFLCENCKKGAHFDGMTKK